MAVNIKRDPVTIDLDDGRSAVLRRIKYSGVNAFVPAGRGYFYFGDKTQKIGLMDWKGRVILKPIWERVSPYYDDGVIIGIRGKMSVLFDLKGKTLTQLPLERLLEANAGTALFDASGAVSLADAVGDFSEGLAVAKTGRHCSYINAQGHTVIETERSYCGEFHCKRARFLNERKVGFFRTEKTWGYLDQNGKVAIEAIYSDARRFSHGWAAVRSESGWRYIDPDGKQLECFESKCGQKLPVGSFYLAEDFINGYACVLHMGRSDVQMIADGSYMAYSDREGGWGLLHESGELTVPMEYQRIGEVNEYGICLYTQRDHKHAAWGLMSARGEKRTSDTYVDIKYLNGGCFALVDAAGNQFAAGRDGRIIGQRAWDEVGSLVSEGICVRRGEKWGMIDFEGREIVPFEYDDQFCFCQGIAFVQRDRRGEIISRDGRVLSSMEIHVSIPLVAGLSLVSYENDLWLLDYGYSPEADDSHKEREREKRMRS